MRELKFRAWYELSMHYFDFEDAHHEGAASGGLGVGWDFSDSPIMQYVGITDSLNRGIYEGDIVSYSYQASQDADSALIFKREVVEWDKDYSGFLPFIHMKRCNIKTNDLKIIGNIYGNPDVLEAMGGKSILLNDM